MNSLKLHVFLTLLSLPLLGYCQIHRERLATDNFDFTFEDLGKSRHSNIDHEKWKKIAKKRGASFYYYNIGTTSYRMGVNSTLNTGDARYFVHYYNLNSLPAEKIQQREAERQRKEIERQLEIERNRPRIIETSDSVTVQSYKNGELWKEEVFVNDDFLKQNDWNNPKYNYSTFIHNSLRLAITYWKDKTSYSTFKNGRVLETTYYSKENPDIKTIWIKHLPDDILEWEYYHNNGKVKEQYKTKNYKKFGKHYEYDENGNLISEKEY